MFRIGCPFGSITEGITSFLHDVAANAMITANTKNDFLITKIGFVKKMISI
jgi:hypothetical protein